MAQAQAVDPPPPQSYPPAPAVEGYPPPGAYAAPPPAEYPGFGQQQPQAPGATTSRSGQGFWEGCCSALCCCCVFEVCF
ncbi:hypothetical protein MKX01_039734 [Papaver californicum]|nr:hypothetical protein MKX01_039734 [Papaver californicum]